MRNKKCDMFVLTLIKVTDKRRSSVSSVKRGRYVGTRRFRVRGQRTVNKVALTALKYFIALIAATLIA